MSLQNATHPIGLCVCVCVCVVWMVAGLYYHRGTICSLSFLFCLSFP
jgi:hypothetical protein